ncbi:hypothetical protein B6U99_07750 [Candidatus Geothermarchaeota archaeon ex4572_27]|nr:MAG: hypothetical protein B6U99_07750 [Candidatus Geothermarchaeota archaeon ex4572_27]
MRENLPANAVVACWWDYGYHTAVVADRASICDNAALDQRQIAMVARAFLSDEEEALKIFRELGATHVVVFGFVVPAYEWAKVEELRGYWISLGGVVGDDVVKSRWMALIAGLDPADYLGTTTFRLPNADVLVSIVTPMGERAEDAVLYRMIFNNYEGPLRLWRGKILKRVEVDEQMNVVGVEEFHVKPLEHFKLVYASEPNRFVLVYEIVYD